MITVFKNSSLVAQIWAKQSQPHGTNRHRNFSFERETLYSYREPIAFFAKPDVVLFNQNNYSSTTSSHQSLADKAVFHKEIRGFWVNNCKAYCKEAHQKNVDVMLLELKINFERFYKATFYYNRYAEATQRTEEQIIAYCKEFELEVPCLKEWVISNQIGIDFIVEKITKSCGKFWRAKTAKEKHYNRAKDLMWSLERFCDMQNIKVPRIDSLILHNPKALEIIEAINIGKRLMKR